MAAGVDGDQGLADVVARRAAAAGRPVAAAARRRVSAAALAAALAARRRCSSRAPLGVVRPRSTSRRSWSLFISAFWSVDPSPARSSTTGASTTSSTIFDASRPTADRAAHDRHRGRGDGHRRDPRLPARVLHGARRVAAACDASCSSLVLLPLWSSYLVRIYAWRLILATTARSTGRSDKLGLPDVNLGYTNWAMWIVFSYIWLPFMILPVYAALERVPDSLPRGLGATSGEGLATFRARAAAARAARASSPARSSRSR